MISSRGDLVCVGAGGCVVRFDRRAPDSIAKFEERSQGVCLSDDGGAFASYDGDAVRLFEVRSDGGGRVAEWRTRRAVRRVRFTAAGEPYAAERGGSVVALKKDLTEPHVWLSPPGMLLDATLAGDETMLAACDRDEKIRVCRFPRTDVVAAYCVGHDEWVGRIETLPHNTKLGVTASGDKTVRLWNLTTGRELWKVDLGGPVDNLTTAPLDAMSSVVRAAVVGSDRLYNLIASRDNFIMSSTLAPFIISIDGTWSLHSLNNKVVAKEWNVDATQLVREVALPIEDAPAPVSLEDLLPLYKKRMDGVQEYRERKRARVDGQERNASKRR